MCAYSVHYTYACTELQLRVCKSVGSADAQVYVNAGTADCKSLATSKLNCGKPQLSYHI